MSSSKMNEFRGGRHAGLGRLPVRLVILIGLACSAPTAHARAQEATDEESAETSTEATSSTAYEPDERVVWTGEIQGEPAKLVMSPKSPTVVGIFLAWYGPVARTGGVAAGSAVATYGDLRSAANFRIEADREPLAQVPLPALGRWNVEVVPPVADAEKVFAKPITFAITAGESTVEPPPKRRPIRSFFRQPQVRYTIIGVGCFVAAILIIVRSYRG